LEPDTDIHNWAYTIIEICMGNIMKKIAIFMTIIMLCSAIILGCIREKQEQVTTVDETASGLISSTAEKPQSLMVYCGVGMRKPMDEIGSLFKEKYDISIDYNYAGSGHLLNQVELAQMGDVYQPGAMYYLDIARNKSFIDYEKLVAYHVPVIAVPKGNPANITCLADLGKPGVRLAMGDPKACAIGKVGNNILEKNGIKDAVEENTIARGAEFSVDITRLAEHNMGLKIGSDVVLTFKACSVHVISKSVVPEEQR